MDSTDLNSPRSSEAERPAEPDYLHSEEDEPVHETPTTPNRDSYEDIGSPIVRNPSRSRPDASLAFRGRMSEMMSNALFEQIAVERSEIAFKEFYDFLAPKVYSVIYRILRTEDDALDILQEVFTHFWNTAPELYKLHTNISAWILLLARNRAIDETRSFRFQKQSHTESYDVRDHEYIADDTSAPDDKLTTEGSSQEIRAAFETLTPDQRKIMELVFFGGMSMKAVADTLHVNPGTVRKSVHDAVKKLRKVLKPDDATRLNLAPTPKTPRSQTIPPPKRERMVKVEKNENHGGPELNTAKRAEPIVEPKKEKSTEKATSRAEGRTRRAQKLHSILDDLMKNRGEISDTTEAMSNLSADSVLEQHELDPPDHT
jgi:RNA polymerase sigma-70 factor (ECF subfamily)